MHYSSIRRCLTVLVAVGASLGAERADGQAWNYPSFQPPVHVSREYNFGIASGGDAGTTFVGQWREGFRRTTHLVFEAGVSDGGDLDSRILLGAGFATTVFGSQPNLPLDILLTSGVYPSFGDGTTLIRVPVGLTLGKRLALQDLAITPYAHPRLSFDFCSGDLCFDDNLDFSINFDLGADFEINPQLGFRASILVAGGDSFDDNAFGASLVWRPRGVSR
ncbi:MAG: hypothetical protein H7Z74_13560 [Anaerolineae bacterium]|nr:hypothetical protein [Gemmatimonadaceae bacterium]